MSRRPDADARTNAWKSFRKAHRATPYHTVSVDQKSRPRREFQPSSWRGYELPQPKPELKWERVIRPMTNATPAQSALRPDADVKPPQDITFGHSMQQVAEQPRVSLYNRTAILPFLKPTNSTNTPLNSIISNTAFSPSTGTWIGNMFKSLTTGAAWNYLTDGIPSIDLTGVLPGYDMDTIAANMHIIKNQLSELASVTASGVGEMARSLGLSAATFGASSIQAILTGAYNVLNATYDTMKSIKMSKQSHTIVTTSALSYNSSSTVGGTQVNQTNEGLEVVTPSIMAGATIPNTATGLNPGTFTPPGVNASTTNINVPNNNASTPSYWTQPPGNMPPYWQPPAGTQQQQPAGTPQQQPAGTSQQQQQPAGAPSYWGPLSGGPIPAPSNQPASSTAIDLNSQQTAGVPVTSNMGLTNPQIADAMQAGLLQIPSKVLHPPAERGSDGSSIPWTSPSHSHFFDMLETYAHLVLNVYENTMNTHGAVVFQESTPDTQGLSVVDRFLMHGGSKLLVSVISDAIPDLDPKVMEFAVEVIVNLMAEKGRNNNNLIAGPGSTGQSLKEMLLQFPRAIGNAMKDVFQADDQTIVNFITYLSTQG
jgi:hypothetical protein